uniref:Uncharacterized protein n=1 Tax=Anopheles atroparvus TaxID=41427 RepID=A0A182J6Q1_ANOAO
MSLAVNTLDATAIAAAAVAAAAALLLCGSVASGSTNEFKAAIAARSHCANITLVGDSLHSRSCALVRLRESRAWDPSTQGRPNKPQLISFIREMGPERVIRLPEKWKHNQPEVTKRMPSDYLAAATHAMH